MDVRLEEAELLVQELVGVLALSRASPLVLLHDPPPVQPQLSPSRFHSPTLLPSPLLRQTGSVQRIRQVLRPHPLGELVPEPERLMQLLDQLLRVGDDQRAVMLDQAIAKQIRDNLPMPITDSAASRSRIL